MPETLFALNDRNCQQCQSLFRGTRGQDYYLGDYWIDDAPDVEVRAEKKSAGPHTIIRMFAATRQYFRRTQKHIREDATDLSVLWFVQRGTLLFSDQRSKKEVGPGDFLITRSIAPFFIELAPDERGLHEVLHVTVPTHLLRRYFTQDIAHSLKVSGRRREMAIAETILSAVFADDGDLAEDTRRMLVESALTAIGHALRHCEGVGPVRQSIAEQRLGEVLRFIEVRLSDPHLSTAMVSKGCRISPRYLSLLLRMNGASFSEIVWNQRLEMARNWLVSSDRRDIPISEIAYGVGFKSPAHFSRMFKRVYDQNPRDYRAAAVETVAPFAEYSAGAAVTLQ
jgi:AraC-like DNA-binding protein